MNRLLRCPLMLVGRCLELIDLSLRLAGVDGCFDVGLGCALGGAEVGVGCAAGDPFEVAVDEAGVGLGFGACVEALVGELDEVGAALCGELLS